jgi:hypothetical protein
MNNSSTGFGGTSLKDDKMRPKNLPELRMRYRGSRELRVMGWKALLHAWGLLLDYYDAPDEPSDDRDVAYWYGEQTLNGVLAAAAWKIPGGWSLQEFTGRTSPQTQERSNADSCEEQSMRRRGDMWLGFEKREDSFAIEAKVAWVGLNVKQACKEVQRRFACAHNQLTTLYATHRQYCYGHPMAVVYAVPEIPTGDIPSPSERDIKSLFREILAQFENKSFMPLIAAYRCRGDRAQWPSETTRAMKYIYPGVIFIARYWTSFNGEDFRRMKSDCTKVGLIGLTPHLNLGAVC